MYQVLYRKYRPKVFDDVVGQEHITSTLQNEIKNGSLSHAYLFTGSRGTGKTTCAKILSKAVNCLHPVNGNPCNECEICKGIESGAILDVVEIDAASNNGVDNIRDIRDEANFAPAAAKYRVYIIDEVHMLSIGAFNALLKTLEEPPEHVKFILATTEVHKLPVTILSRCQRFDFKRVSAESMKKRIDYIAAQENFTVDEEAAKLIARLADGGMRDALSMLDRCISQSSEVTTEVVSAVAGLTGKKHLFDLSAAISQNDTSKALSLINELHANSFDMERLCSELIAHFRALMITLTVRQPENVLVSTAEEIEEYKSQAASMSLTAVLRCIDAFQSALANIKQGVNRRTELELTVIKLSAPDISGDMESLKARIESLEAQIASAARPIAKSNVPPMRTQMPSQPARSTAPVAGTEEAPAVQTNIVQQSDASKSTEIVDGEFAEWGNVMSFLNKNNKPLWSILIGTSAYVRDGVLVIRSDDPTVLSVMMKKDKNTRALLVASHDVTGKRIRQLAIEGANAAPSSVGVNSQEGNIDAFLSKAKELGIDVSVED